MKWYTFLQDDYVKLHTNTLQQTESLNTKQMGFCNSQPNISSATKSICFVFILQKFFHRLTPIKDLLILVKNKFDNEKLKTNFINLIILKLKCKLLLLSPKKEIF